MSKKKEGRNAKGIPVIGIPVTGWKVTGFKTILINLTYTFSTLQKVSGRLEISRKSM
ncbi:MAG: hypothetical protein V3S97_03820 [Candidatus Bathyarchaeia archaeon]